MSNTFKDLMDSELSRVRAKGHVCRSWHEGYGLIAEEFEEFWDEVKKRPTRRDRVNALKELVQVAALCERVAIDLALVAEYEECLERGLDPMPKHSSSDNTLDGYKFITKP